MRKVVAFLLTVSVLLYASVAFAVDFDPSMYTNEELEEIQRIIASYLPKTLGNQVIYDDDGLYIESRGIYEYSKSRWIVNLYIDNLLGENIHVQMIDARANRYNIGISSASATISDDSIYMASANLNYIIDVDDLKLYEITNLDRLDFNLLVLTDEYYRLVEIPVRIDTDMPVSD